MQDHYAIYPGGTYRTQASFAIAAFGWDMLLNAAAINQKGFGEVMNRYASWMQQYMDAKAACGDALLLFRMGDFYELFHDDAKVAAESLGLTLTSRDKGKNAIPMAGFPHHQLDSYMSKLIKEGFRVAVCAGGRAIACIFSRMAVLQPARIHGSGLAAYSPKPAVRARNRK